MFLEDKKFTYLHTNTEYSFLESTIRLKNLFEEAKKQGSHALAITDKNNLFGFSKFLDYAKKYQIKPIIGLEVMLSNKVSVIALAKNYQGFIELGKIVKKISQNEYILIEDLESDNLFIIDHMDLGFKAFKLDYPNINNFYANSPIKQEIKTVFAPTKNMLFKSEYKALKALKAIKQGSLLKDTDFEDFQKSDFFNFDNLKNVDNEVLNQTTSLANAINLEFPKKALHLQKYSSNEQDSFELLRQKVKSGLHAKKSNFLESEYELIAPRVKYELEIIKQLNFADYFLIIQDAIAFARENNIAVGPGRGSAAGSLVCFLLDITRINPLRYDLLFERFLNPDRVTMPDIDIDFQDDRRDEVFNYVQAKYGKDHTAFITTYQSIGAKNAIRDTGRILEIPLLDIDRISKSLVDGETLNQSFETNNKYIIQVSKFENLHEIASQLEGLPRQIGVHPAGILISDQKIENIVPVFENASSSNQVQVPLEYLEDYGLLKIDFLGLKTLKVISDIEKHIKSELHFDVLLEKENTLINDPLTLDILNQGQTEGVFQLESSGMKKTIKKVNVDSFHDLFTIISLFRPGPMAYIDQYSEGKKNSQLIRKIHPLYDDIVEPTMGIIVYQEQIMKIAQKVSNMTFAQADLLRRAISKKKEEEILSYKTDFFNGGLQNGFSDQQLNEIYENILRFADYGFNKAHAVSYAYITFKMAFYKKKYPIAFYKALISAANGSHDTVNKYVIEAKKNGIIVNSPDINHSKYNISVIDNQLYLPFLLVKGVGASAVEKIVKEKNDFGQFSSFVDAYMRLVKSGVGASVINTLIQANVFRCFGNQEQILAQSQTLDKVATLIKNKIKNANSEQEKHEIYLHFFEAYDLGVLKTLPDLKQNLAKEAENEQKLLGAIYNAFITKKYEHTIRLSNLPLYRKVDLVIYAKEILRKRNKEWFEIKAQDSSDDISIFAKSDLFDANYKEFEGKLLKVTISKSSSGFINVHAKEILNEQ
ncbi:DNA polymerase III subunit alpha [Mycoplasma sp. Ms02]|uniref:DNA polymerase III subunit alpha n=1 Tax=Mycoplasma sp. Ms02 TaxID=353851 RepID=UPI001C88E3F6|nr:DNA polymerase III subunit alpha [Mycoplasma sp. Ms02]QZE12337.1 DNA polymerase III subunit alpha [Mycoplasma sp. Ms02]